MAIIYFIILSHGIHGIGCQSLHGVLPGPQEVARPLVAERQSHAGVRVAGSELEAAVQEILAEIFRTRPGEMGEMIQKAEEEEREERRCLATFCQGD